MIFDQTRFEPSYETLKLNGQNLIRKYCTNEKVGDMLDHGWDDLGVNNGAGDLRCHDAFIDIHSSYPY